MSLLRLKSANILVLHFVLRAHWFKRIHPSFILLKTSYNIVLLKDEWRIFTAYVKFTYNNASKSWKYRTKEVHLTALNRHFYYLFGMFNWGKTYTYYYNIFASKTTGRRVAFKRSVFREKNPAVKIGRTIFFFHSFI